MTSTTLSTRGWPATSTRPRVLSPPSNGSISTRPSAKSPTSNSSSPNPAHPTWSSPPMPASSATASLQPPASSTLSVKVKSLTSVTGSGKVATRSSISRALLPSRAKATRSSQMTAAAFGSDTVHARRPPATGCSARSGASLSRHSTSSTHASIISTPASPHSKTAMSCTFPTPSTTSRCSESKPSIRQKRESSSVKPMPSLSPVMRST